MPIELYESLGTCTPDNLVAGDAKIVTAGITLASNAGALMRGTVLGKVTADGTYKQCLSASSDGSQTPDAILAENVPTSTEQLRTVAYLSGQFAESGLTLGTGLTLDGIRDTLRDKNIYLTKTGS